MTNYDVFHQWLEHCPVPFEYLSEDESDGQTAYVFHINGVIDDGYVPFKEVAHKHYRKDMDLL